MHCPMCNHTKSIVLETRSANDEHTLRRRRKCASCSHNYSTVERIIDDISVVISKDGHRTPFNRKILADSFMLSGKDSLSEESREAITEKIMFDLKQRGPTVTTSEIAKAALDHLAVADWKTWLRYALKVINVETIPEYIQWVNANSASKDDLDNKDPQILVQKKGGSIEYFSGSKLYRSIQHASQGRLTDQSLIAELTNNISIKAKAEYIKSGKPISTADIGVWVESSLVLIDPLAALSYSILFRSVDSPASLENAAQKIEAIS